MSIIKVENLSKKYIIGHNRNAGGAYNYGSLRDSLAHTARGLYQRLRHPLSPNRENTDLEEFWALKDINFEINQGDRVGIIGRNGAGKSTLLKILSRITEPTTGRIEINGRVASLLEVGTGFHPELSGRENIYLNGAVMGMTRQEIKNKFDEIVAFAEVEKFLDTPVKRYSSGMYVRLAFAVAAHLEPEILIVDEVLAVGDAQFQKKCLGKMEDVSKEGRTVLFVSHNMNAIRQLCKNAIQLDKGTIVTYNSDIEQAINSYQNIENEESCINYTWNTSSKTPDNSFFHLSSICLLDEDKIPLGSSVIRKDKNFYIRIVGIIQTLSPALEIGIRVYDPQGNVVFVSQHCDKKEELWPKLKCGQCDLFCEIPKHLLNEGAYTAEVCVSLFMQAWLYEPRKHAPYVNFKISGPLSESPYWNDRRAGNIAPILGWTSLHE